MLLAPLLPHYDDLTLFTVSLAFLLLFWIDGTMRHDLILCLASGGEAAPALILFLGLGMVCSLLSVFLRREKFQFEKGVMLLFAVLVTAGTGLYAGWLMLGHSPVWLMVFPVWNILNAGVLLVLLLARAIDTECIVDEKATLGKWLSPPWRCPSS